ncbi:hypothetical protein F5880DRAFT_932037 [Lentinula raphanica]|nr:hypothetical protein F5880DRAFT_932037 [Lentinula raphanica]
MYITIHTGYYSISLSGGFHSSRGLTISKGVSDSASSKDNPPTCGSYFETAPNFIFCSHTVMGFPCPAIALAAAFFASSTLLAVQAFSFSATPAVIDSCGNVTLTWTGGSPPFYLLAIPIFGTPRNISIPDSAYQNDVGSYSTQLSLPEGQRYILSMSDSTGFGSGGDTQILQMGDASSESCNTTDPGSAFTFQLNAALQQCREFTFEAYTAAIQPVTITTADPILFRRYIS